MKCPKCGAIVSEKDKFCEECGTALQHLEIEINKEEKAPEEEQNSALTSSPSKEKKRKKTGITLGIVICVGVILLIAAIASILSPSEQNFEAAELAGMIDEDTEGTYSKYEGDTLHVHGYLYRDDVADYCLLYSDKDIDLENADLEEILLFSPADDVVNKLSEIGNGSEITITGVLEPITKDMVLLALDAQEVEIIEAEERTYAIESVGDIINNPEKYFDKKVSFAAVVSIAGYKDVFACDIGNEYNGEYLSLVGISEKQAEKIKYGIYAVVGRVCDENEQIAVSVERIELMEELDAQKTEYEFESVKSLFDVNLQSYVGSGISVYGKIVTGSGANPTIMLYDPVSGMDIELYTEGNDELWYHDSEAVTVHGILGGGVGDPYFIRVERFDI